VTPHENVDALVAGARATRPDAAIAEKGAPLPDAAIGGPA
jgi:hypothetical protein